MPDSSASPVKGPASYFPSIEAKYGQPISHWMEVLRAAGARKHMEYVALLKTDHGMGHGHANALVAAFLVQAK
ncbi:hypothetical protein HNP48_002658 [Acidovorax soli]|uniref:DUF4287 domain-containing protein n=1 Tax=Acidovorax soli TaxID=592050 RepID=A0A7X0PEF0_9BURK|nr:DUF4287 domain-containing protein [Acidovorax soli]MBB6559986.1 hypothetical protein [Acidovorax soli]